MPQNPTNLPQQPATITSWGPEQRFLRLFIVLLIVGGVLYLLRGILLPFILAVAISYPLLPLARRLERRGLSRGQSAAIVMVIVFGILILFLAIVVPILVQQTIMFSQNLPTYVEMILTWAETLLNSLGLSLNNLVGDVTQNASNGIGGVVSFATSALSNVLRSTSSVFGIIALLLVTPAVIFYFLKDRGNIYRRVLHLLPVRWQPVVAAQVTEADDALSGFMRGQFLVSVSLAVFYAVAFSLAGMSFGWLVGLFAGFLSAIPLVGALIAFAVTALVAVFQFAFAGDWIRLIAVGGIFLIGQVLENNLLVPRLIGDRIGIHPVWMIFGVLTGGALFGVLGVIFVVPVMAVLAVILKFSVSIYMDSEFYKRL